MRLPPPILLLLPLLALLFLSCDQDITSSKDQPLVDYVLIVTDSATALPLDSVSVHYTIITGDTATVLAGAADGRAELPTIASGRTLFEFTRPGYQKVYLTDTVNTPRDTVFNRPTIKLLHQKMARINAVLTGRAQLNLFLRDADLNKLPKGKVTFIDSNGFNRILVDDDSDGVIGLAGLKWGKNQVRVQAAGFLGHWFEVDVEKVADSVRTIPSTTVTLIHLDNSITGQVYAKTGLGAAPLTLARVEFCLKDTLAYPDTFSTLTSAKLGSEGKYTLDSVPALDGELRFFKDAVSREPTLTKPISKEEVMQDGPSPLVTLTISLDSLGIPLLVSGPRETLNLNDSVNASDTLKFKFNQAVDLVDELTVRLINSSPVWINSAWNADKTVLKVWPRESTWEAGKKYEYEMIMRNAQGDFFALPGDTLRTMNGDFSVRKSAAADSAVLFPTGFQFTCFNSGADGRFDVSDTNTSPKADSTSQFARLKWSWQAGAGKKVDSLSIWYKDGGVTATNYQLWSTIPVIDDSTTLNFSDHYSTSRDHNQNPDFPLLSSASAQIFFKVVPKTRAKSFDDSATALDVVNQGMGPTVYVQYPPVDTSLIHGGNVNTVLVNFLTKPLDPSSAYAWGSSPPKPKLYYDDVEMTDTNTLAWNWDVNGIDGHLEYKLPNIVPAAPRIRVDLNGVLFSSKPIWQRNRKSVLTLR